MQKRLVNASKDCEAKDLANISKSFVALEMLKLRLKMKPAPKPVDTTKLTPTRAHAHERVFGQE